MKRKTKTFPMRDSIDRRIANQSEKIVLFSIETSDIVYTSTCYNGEFHGRYAFIDEYTNKLCILCLH